ncbi:MAG: HEPN domain-containing protein [Lachnospiraceae bacterium]|nr:HEPN domain-containing protein [Lachnospiraceae bacterium]
MCDIRLFKRAWLDYKAAESLLAVPQNEEANMNYVAYHLQQAVEKSLKAFLECVGVTVPNTHDIDKLVRMSKNNGSAVEITDWIEEKADMRTRWETDTRYDIDYFVEKKQATAGLEEIGKYLEINGLKETLREELESEEIKNRLRRFFPKNFEPGSNFEWNCYYQIYRKRLKKATEADADPARKSE